MGSLAGRLTTAAAVLAASVLAAPAAQASWGAGQEVARLGPGLTFALAGNARGDRIIVWDRPAGGFDFATAPPGGQFGRRRRLRPRDDFSEYLARVELDELGNALLVTGYFDETDPQEDDIRDESCCNGLRARVIRRNGTASAAKTLGPPGRPAELADLHVGPRGEIGVVWHDGVNYVNSDARMAARFGTLSRGFGAREAVPMAERYDRPAALSFVHGRARVLFARSLDRNQDAFENRRSRVVEVERLRSRRWSRERTVAPRVAMSIESLKIATAWRGEQALAWRGRASQHANVYAATRRPGSGLRTRLLGPENTLYYGLPAPAIEKSGAALAMWTSLSRGTFVGSVRRPAGRFGPLVPFGPQADRVQLNTPIFAVNASGLALVVWDETPLGGTPKLVGAFRDPDGALVERQVLLDPGSYSVGPYAATLDRAGRGSVAHVSDGRLVVTPARVGDG
ncbi:MAG TPA: hypothetical protein VF520_06815 [Thermoleophilaceae bacterium]|jgi:hypothetical protein